MSNARSRSRATSAPTLTRHDRYTILMKAGAIIAARRDDLARLITLESGLCLKDSQYEVGRASDVLLFAANQALVDDSQVFSCDLTAHGKSRKVYTLTRAAARRDHRDHPVQSSAEPGDPQSGARGRHQQPRRAQAQREDAAHRACAGRHPL